MKTNKTENIHKQKTFIQNRQQTNKNRFTKKNTDKNNKPEYV